MTYQEKFDLLVPQNIQEFICSDDISSIGLGIELAPYRNFTENEEDTGKHWSLCLKEIINDEFRKSQGIHT